MLLKPEADCYIVGTAKCSTKPLSKILTYILGSGSESTHAWFRSL